MNRDLKEGRNWALYLGKNVLKKENSRCKSPVVEAGVLEEQALAGREEGFRL